MIPFERDIVFFDLETTGTSVENDRIVEICAIKLDKDFKLIESKVAKVNPTIPIPKCASDIHGITDDMVKDCSTFKQLSKSIYKFMLGCDIAGYNSTSFDVPLLYAEFRRAEILWDYSGINFIDVCGIFKNKEGRTLTDAMMFYCSKEHEDAHGALADVEATIEVFKAQVERYGLNGTLPSQVALLSNFDKPLLDLSGKFTTDKNGNIIFNFGVHKGELAKNERSYLEWMVNKGTFLEDTKQIARNILHPKPQTELPI